MPETKVEGRTEPLVGGVRQTTLVAGACAMIMGVAFAVWPHKSLVTAELLSGVYLLLNGAVQSAVAVGARFATPLRALVLVSGVLSALLGMLCLAGGNSTSLLSFWIGLAWAIRGICHATVAVWVDELPDRGRQELFGLVTLALGVLVGVLPFDSTAALGWVAGPCVIAIGATEFFFAGGTRRAVAPVPPMAPTWRLDG
ncbi:HdeD family acid-resistance protein [Nocardia asteroides]